MDRLLVLMVGGVCGRTFLFTSFLDICFFRKLSLNRSLGIIFCGNPYTFEESLLPIVNELNNSLNFLICIEQGNFIQMLLPLLTDLKAEEKIYNFKVTNFHSKDHNQIIQNCNHFISEVQDLPVKLVIFSDDFTIPSQILSSHFKLKNVLTCLVPYGLLQPIVYYSYFFRTNKMIFLKLIFSPNKELVESISISMLKSSIRFILLLYSYITKTLILGYLKVLRFSMQHSIHLSNSRSVRYNFSSGNCDFLVMHDPIDMKCANLLFPQIDNILLAKHPSARLCKDPSLMNAILLLIPGAYHEEFPLHILNKISNILKKVMEYSMIDEVHFRFHPREGTLVREQFRNYMSEKGISFLENNSLENSICLGICRYRYIIGSTSSSLRFARQCSHFATVIGLKNACFGDYWTQPYGIGNMEGIIWVNSEEELFLGSGEVFNSSDDCLPSVSEIILRKMKGLV